MKFDLSFWNYLYIDDYYADMKTAVAEWKELGITIGFSFRYNPDFSTKSKMYELLDLCAENGIKLIISDDRVFWTRFRDDGRENYLKSVKEAHNDFGGHSACYGFYLGDEPDKTQFEVFGNAYKSFKSISDKVGFINYCWNEGINKVYGGRDNYKKFLSEFYDDVKTETVSNDRYSAFNFCEYEEGFLEKGKEYYFSDARMFSALAKEKNVPYFISQLSVGHWNFRTPDVNGIRWQLSTAAALGANVVQWFFIYQHRYHEDYYEYPVDKLGNKNEVYGYIVRETLSFKERVLKQLEGYDHEKTYFITKAYGGYPLLTEETDEEWYVYSDHGYNGILAKFSGNGGVKYLLVNNDQHVPELFYVKNKLDSTKDHYIWLAAGGTHVFG